MIFCACGEFGRKGVSTVGRTAVDPLDASDLIFNGDLGIISPIAFPQPPNWSLALIQNFVIS
jgi:hypothetical protein